MSTEKIFGVAKEIINSIDSEDVRGIEIKEQPSPNGVSALTINLLLGDEPKEEEMFYMAD